MGWVLFPATKTGPSISSVPPKIPGLTGDVAILYKKSCQFTISKFDIQINDRIMGIQIDSKHLKPLYAFSVYLPSVNYSYNDYAECIDYLDVAHGIEQLDVTQK